MNGVTVSVSSDLGMHLVSDQGSERATCDDGKIIACDGRIHVLWQDVTREGYLNRVRSYDQSAGTWTEPVTLNQGVDNHARAVMTVDHDGYLHAILGGHGSPVAWCRSERPRDSGKWTDPQTIGAGTYPVFMCDVNNTLYLTVRHQAPGERGIGVDLYARPQDGSWRKVGRIVRRADEYWKTYSAYHMQLAAARDGTLHAVIDFYEGQDEHGRGLHQAVCYMRSRDGGATWEKADGTPVRTPARPEDMDVFARSIESRHEQMPPPEIHHGGLVVDSAGRPFAFFMNHGERSGRLVLAMIDETGGWQREPLRVLEEAWPDMRATECKATMREDGVICALVTLTPFDGAWKDGRPTRAMNMTERADRRLAWLLTDDGGESFTIHGVLEPGTTFNCPSVEKPVGANAVSADRLPSVVWFDGSKGYPGGGDYYDRSRTVAEILESGGFRQTNVWLRTDRCYDRERRI